jgi:hypothetical protein
MTVDYHELLKREKWGRSQGNKNFAVVVSQATCIRHAAGESSCFVTESRVEEHEE